MTPGNPLTSIIVRTKDRPKLLKRALRSIAAQDYRPIEVVLVNDGGCDLDTEEIRDVLAGLSLSYVRLTENLGRARAGNAGIENARGAYIGFLDDDDELYPNHVSTLVTFLERSDYKVAYADSEMVFQDFSAEEGKFTDVERLVFSRDFSFPELLVGNYIPFNSLLFSDALLKASGGLDPGFELYEDWDLLIRIAAEHPLYHVKKLTARYIQWDKGRQINRSNAAEARDATLNVFAKHRDKLSPELVLWLKGEKERNDFDIAQVKSRCAALEASLSERDSRIAELGWIIADRDNRIVQRDEMVAEKDSRIKESDARIVQMEAMIREEKERIGRLESAVRERNERIALLDSVVKASDLRLAQLESDVRDKDRQARQLSEALALMQATLGWQFMESFRSSREKLLPIGTRRRKTYELIVRAVKSLKRQGRGIAPRESGHMGEAAPVAVGKGAATEALPLRVERSHFLHFPSKRKLSVLFLKGAWAGLTNHYRVYNMREYLAALDVYAEILDIEELPSTIPHAFTFDLVIVHRVPMNALLAHYLAKCRELGITVIFDLDDYLFDPSVISGIEWVQHASPGQREELIEHIMQCKQTFDACDYFLCPTDFLARRAEEAGKEAFVVRNGFSRELLDIAEEVLRHKESLETSDTIRIGYFSGTKTHQKDFHSVAPAIIRILNEYREVRLVVHGLLDLEPEFDGLLHKIERTPFVPLEQLLPQVARVDINIAPLELGNVFCEAKSELKYFYAGILKIPTVATPTDAFTFAISNGENGFLAATEAEWYACLKSLIEDSSLRKRIGEKAHSHVLSTYAPQVLAETVRNTYAQIITKARERRNIPEAAFSVTIFVADVAEHIQEYADLITVSELLANRGHHVKLCFFRSSNGAQTLSHPSDVFLVQGTDHVVPADLFICTDEYNSSVIAYQNRKKAAHLIFLQRSGQTGAIPYRWATQFTVIPYSLNAEETAGRIEELAWQTAP